MNDPVCRSPLYPLRIVGWILVTFIGLGCLSVLAVHRGETLNAIWLVVASICVFAIAWRFHSAWLVARVLTLEDTRVTPALRKDDGKDYVPSNKWVVFGHHFAAIAGPGPLVGPVLASQFGYLPGTLWILVGATLGGAVHDCIVLFCSVRRSGKSLPRMVADEVGPFAGILSLTSILAIIVIVLAVLALVVVKALAESSWGLFTIAATIPLAMAMGMGIKNGWTDIKVISALGVFGLVLSVLGGRWIQGTPIEGFFHLSEIHLAWIVMGYGLLASTLPVWLLLAPRDYLSSFLKIGAVGFLGIAVIFVCPDLQMPALTKFIDGTGPVFAGGVFPFCFITIACAAVSGFHAIIASGTTPKMLSSERDIRLVGYGGMITEMLVGIIALVAACTMPPGQYFAINMKGEPAAVVKKVTDLGFPVTEMEMNKLAERVGEKSMIGRTGGAPSFALGMANMFSQLVDNPAAIAIWYHFAIMFEALFILTTIDAGTRVGRFLVQDLLGKIWKPLGNTESTPGNLLASVVFVGGWGYFLLQGVLDPLGGINSFWPIFGIANQLLAVIALSLGTTVLLKMGRARFIWVTVLPLVWLMAVTLTAGYQKIFASDPRLGFLSAARDFSAKVDGGGKPAEIAAWSHQIFNNHVNCGVTALFVFMVILIVAANAYVWIGILRGRKEFPLCEDEPVF